jgi:hypothetical protein
LLLEGWCFVVIKVLGVGVWLGWHERVGGAAAFKGDKRLIANNTIFDSSDEQTSAALFIMMYDPTKPWESKEKTRTQKCFTTQPTQTQPRTHKRKQNTIISTFTSASQARVHVQARGQAHVEARVQACTQARAHAHTRPQSQPQAQVEWLHGNGVERTPEIADSWQRLYRSGKKLFTFA